MPENFDFKSVPKVIIDGTVMGMSKQFISLAIRTGTNISVFAMTPEDAKNIHAALGKTLEMFKIQFGEIEDSNKPIPTPFDLSEGGEKK